MSTQGFIGTVRHGHALTIFNTYDSGPQDMLPGLVALLKRHHGLVPELVDSVSALERVHEDDDLSDEHLRRLAAAGWEPKWRNPHRKTWFDVATFARGNLDVFVQAGALPVFAEGPAEGFVPFESFEWGYLINADTDNLDVLRGNHFYDLETGHLSFEIDSMVHIPDEMVDRLVTAVNGTLDADTAERRMGAKRAIAKLVAADRAEGNIN